MANRELDQQIEQSQKRLVALATQHTTEPDLAAQLAAIKDTLDAVAAQRALDQENERHARVFKVSRMIGTSLDLETVLQMSMDAIIDLTGAERSFVMLLDDGKLELKVGRNFDQETLRDADLTISHTVAQRAVDEKAAIVTTNAQEDARFSGQQSVMAYQLRSIMVTPLKIDERVIGVIYVDSRYQVALFSESELNLLNLFGEQVAIAIDNALEVERREAALKRQIAELQIVIDEAKQSEDVKKITETDTFQSLAARAKEFRERRRKRD